MTDDWYSPFVEHVRVALFALSTQNDLDKDKLLNLTHVEHVAHQIPN